MTGVYYTTKDILGMFMWSKTTLKRRCNDGSFPNPDIEGRPNKWLKANIHAIVAPKNRTELASSYPDSRTEPAIEGGHFN